MRVLVENTHDYAVFATDLEGRVLTWNPAARRLLGYAEEEILGRSSFVTFTPEDRSQGIPERELQTALAEGRASDERWHLKKDGTHTWASGVMTLLKDEAGRPRAFAKVMRDYTVARLAADALRESEERLRVALSAAQMGTWLWRIPTDEQVTDDRGRVRAEFERGLREGGDIRVEFRVTWPDGSLHWLKDQGKVFPGPDGRPLFMAGACVDITERRTCERCCLADGPVGGATCAAGAGPRGGGRRRRAPGWRSPARWPRGRAANPGGGGPRRRSTARGRPATARPLGG